MKTLLPAALVCVCLAPPAPAAAPVEELLRYVPPDVGFCIVLRDLRGHLSAVEQSPFATQFRASPAGQTLRASFDAGQARKAEEFIQNVLGMSIDQLRDEILGEALVFAYRPGPPGKPEQEQGLVLLRARQAKPLAELVERINRAMKLDEVREVEHDGFKYLRRVERGETTFVYLRGPVLVFSGQESMLREALALEKKTPATQESAVGTALRRMGVESALLTMWMNPRALDPEWDAHLSRAASEDEKAFLRTFLRCWKALDGAALTLSTNSDLEMGLTLRGRFDELPAEVRRFLDGAASPSDLWGRFPEDALASLTTRMPASALLEMLGTFRTEQASAATAENLNRIFGAVLGKDLVKEVLPHVGPEWGVCVVAPPKGERPWFPAALFALRVRAGDPAAPVDRALFNGLHSGATFAVIGYNQLRKDPLVLKSERQGAREVRYLASTSGRAIGLQPAYGLCDGYLVLGSTPEAIRSFARAPRPVKHVPGEEFPLLRVSFSELREYLKARRAPLADALAEQHQVTPQQMALQIDALVAGLTLLDRLELTQRTTAGQVAFTLRVRPASPLRK